MRKALRQFTTRRMGWSGLCSSINPLMVGCRWVNVNVFPFGVVGDKCLADVYCFPD